MIADGRCSHALVARLRTAHRAVATTKLAIRHGEAVLWRMRDVRFQHFSISAFQLFSFSVFQRFSVLNRHGSINVQETCGG